MLSVILKTIMLTHDQKEAIKSIKKDHNVMITGPGGTGKTTIINQLKDTTTGTIHGITAMTGAAAVLIGGTTLHSYLGIGLGKDSDDDLLKKINMVKHISLRWCNLKMLVVDEVSMLSADLFDKLNRIAKRIRMSKEPFGGIQLVFVGDFLQLPCIKGEFCFESESWNECKFKICNLTENMRQNNKPFQDFLNRARFGEVTDEDLLYISTAKKTTGNIKHTRIVCDNVNVDAINENKLIKLPAREIHQYKCKIKYNDNYVQIQHKHMFNDITKLCNAQPYLSLSVGAQVMLLVNLDVEKGLVNGSRGVVTEFFPSVSGNKTRLMPIVKFNNAENTEMVIQRYGYEVNCCKNQHLIATIFQIPLKLAYAITVHKSQGMTLDSVNINLKDVFEYGQAYVALSRVKDISNLVVKNATKAAFRAHPKAINFYKNC